MTMLNSNSNCCRLSFHSRSASESAKSSLIVSSESDSEGRESISSSSPFEGGSISDGWEAEGSEMDMKDDEPLSDILAPRGCSQVREPLRYATAEVCAESSRG